MFEGRLQISGELNPVHSVRSGYAILAAAALTFSATILIDTITRLTTGSWLVLLASETIIQRAPLGQALEKSSY